MTDVLVGLVVLSAVGGALAITSLLAAIWLLLADIERLLNHVDALNAAQHPGTSVRGDD